MKTKCSFAIKHNGYMYETLGISGFVTACRYKSRCGAECFKQLSNPQCFIHDVCALHEQ